MRPNESRTSVLCCVLILKQIEIFCRVTSSPLSRPAIWAMCLPTSKGPGASSADGRATRTPARVQDRERCASRRVQVWTCSTALGWWPNGCTARRGYVESDGTSELQRGYIESDGTSELQRGYVESDGTSELQRGYVESDGTSELQRAAASSRTTRHLPTGASVTAVTVSRSLSPR